MDFEPSDSFVEFLVTAEGPKINDKGLHIPYRDSNGHWTNGYGNLLPKDSTGNEAPITEAEARKQLRSNIATKVKSAAKKFNNIKGIQGSWEDLTDLQKEAVTDFEFNVGITKFPSLMKAISSDDKLGIAREFKRYHNWQGEKITPKDKTIMGKDGKRKEPMSGRNKAWWGRFGKPLTGRTFKETDQASRLKDFFESENIDSKEFSYV